MKSCHSWKTMPAACSSSAECAAAACAAAAPIAPLGIDARREGDRLPRLDVVATEDLHRGDFARGNGKLFLKTEIFDGHGDLEDVARLRGVGDADLGPVRRGDVLPFDDFEHALHVQIARDFLLSTQQESHRMKFHPGQDLPFQR